MEDLFDDKENLNTAPIATGVSQKPTRLSVLLLDPLFCNTNSKLNERNNCITEDQEDELNEAANSILKDQNLSWNFSDFASANNGDSISSVKQTLFDESFNDCGATCEKPVAAPNLSISQIFNESISTVDDDKVVTGNLIAISPMKKVYSEDDFKKIKELFLIKKRFWEESEIAYQKRIAELENAKADVELNSCRRDDEYQESEIAYQKRIAELEDAKADVELNNCQQDAIYRKELQALEQKIDELIKENEENLDKQRRDLSESLKLKTNLVDKLVKENESLRLDLAKPSHKELDNEIVRLREQLAEKDNLIDDMNKLEQNNQHLQQEISNIKDKYVNNEQELLSLNSTHMITLQTLEQYQDFLDEMTAVNRDQHLIKDQEISELEKQVRQIELVLTTYSSKYSASQDIIQKQKDNADLLLQEIQKYQHELDCLQMKLTETIRVHDSDRQNLRSFASSLEKNISCLEEFDFNIRNNIDSRDGVLTNIRDHLYKVIQPDFD